MELRLESRHLSASEVEITMTTDQGEQISFVASPEFANVFVPSLIHGTSMWNDSELMIVEAFSSSRKRAFTEGA